VAVSEPEAVATGQRFNLRIVAQTLISFSNRLRSKKMSIRPVATDRGSDTVKHFLGKTPRIEEADKSAF